MITSDNTWFFFSRKGKKCVKVKSKKKEKFAGIYRKEAGGDGPSPMLTVRGVRKMSFLSRAVAPRHLHKW